MKNMTVSKICGEKWPRRLPEGLAAAYCGMTLKKFKTIPELFSLIYASCGELVCDRNDLDAWIIDNKGGKEK